MKYKHWSLTEIYKEDKLGGTAVVPFKKTETEGLRRWLAALAEDWSSVPNMSIHDLPYASPSSRIRRPLLASISTHAHVHIRTEKEACTHT